MKKLSHFKAGYIADSVGKTISETKLKFANGSEEDKEQLDQLQGLLHHVTSFDVYFPESHELDYFNLNPVLATLNNILTRGLPTRAPLLIEEAFVKIGLTEANTKRFEFDFPKATTQFDFDNVFSLLHIIEPNLHIDKSNYAGKLGSNLEWNFINKHPFLKQILQTQRDFSTINNKLQGNRTVDFCFTSPYLKWSLAKRKYVSESRIFEVDGPHHELANQITFDNYRDAIADDEDFKTLRFQQYEIKEDLITYDQLIDQKLYAIFKSNFGKDIQKELPLYSLIFIPLAVARIQKVLIEKLLSTPELLSLTEIRLAIIERDFPCGSFAVSLLEDSVRNLNNLLELEDQLSLPPISLTVINQSQWVIDERLHLHAKLGDEKSLKSEVFDLILDHSILRRSDIYQENTYFNENAIVIRSSHYNDTSFSQSRRVYCADLLKYKSLVSKNEDGSYRPVSETSANINYFIQNIFRKTGFREGQLPIISRALQQKPVIGLLPTGGGKSLSFQLPAMLQPGLCLVVDPIKSLMEDQVRVLRENWIDSCEFINSNLNREEKSARLINFRLGEQLFMFVSPERFVMDDFRRIISTIDRSDFGLAFSFCVIDEVHCVSEWGHDFRSTYLMLGKNAQAFTTTRAKSITPDNTKVTLVGLTATASFDVLSDIERELMIEHEDIANAIIMIENTIRPELFFRVIDVTDKDRMKVLNNEFESISSNLQRINTPEILRKSQRHHFENFDPMDFASENLSSDGQIQFKYKEEFLLPNDLSSNHNDLSSIIFCPVKGANQNDDGEYTNKNGVNYVYTELNSNSKSFFFATDIDKENVIIQNHFLSFVTGNSNHMVCTKAFGMGIDKANVRSTFHQVHSSSLESLVQECGRAGRDKKVAEANILFSKHKYHRFNVYEFFKDHENHPLLKNKFTRKSIRQRFEKKWNDDRRTFENVTFDTLEKLEKEIQGCDFTLIAIAGNTYNRLAVDQISTLVEAMLETEDESYLYLETNYSDRDVHQFFHQNAYKGIDVEKSQFINLFKIREFKLSPKNERIWVEGQVTLEDEFNESSAAQFEFTLNENKLFPNAEGKICGLLDLVGNNNAPFSNRTNAEVVNSKFLYSHDFVDFLLLLEEANLINDIASLNEITRKKLHFLYTSNRNDAGETGRLIYRMHCVGFIQDYRIDYNLGMFLCTFNKFQSIDSYLSKIEIYFRRYLSEQSALSEMGKLKSRLNKETLIENLLECLFFLSEFAYKEIAQKRVRATNEIQNILVQSIEDEKYSDWYEQNVFIKEQMFFYFNAKYARKDFRINGVSYSLLADYQENNDKEQTLYKYLKVFSLEGTEQNNYKHMIGSCKKIHLSFVESDLQIDWVIRLLKTFAMYAVNNPSNTLEANAELEKGFTNLYMDTSFHGNNFDLTKSIFETYFEELEKNITDSNPIFSNIKLIRVNLLLKLQSISLKKFLQKTNPLNTL